MNGPFLYDEGPEPLHTGTPRRSGKLLVLIFGATALLAVLSVVLLPLVKGSAGAQSREVVQVFLAALHKGDDETAYQLLCRQQQGDLSPGDVGGRYLGTGTGSVVGTSDASLHGAPAQDVQVEWDDGARTTLTVVNVDGPHICGVRPKG
jgi:hypothetical protein